MKRIKFTIGAMSMIALIAVIASCGKNPFKIVDAKPGKYIGKDKDGKAYEFYFTKSSAYKAKIGTNYYYGKGEEKGSADTKYRAAITEKTIDVHYQAGSTARLINDKDGNLLYEKVSTGEKIKLEFKEDLKASKSELENKTYKYTSANGKIFQYDDTQNDTTDKRPWGTLNTNTAKKVEYQIKFLPKGKAAITWTEDGTTRYFYGTYEHKKDHRINMKVKEYASAYEGEGEATPKDPKDYTRYAVIDPEDDTVIGFENAPLKRQ